MKEIIGVRFKRPGKIYFFDPKNNKIENGQFVIVETAMGEEYAEVVIPNREIAEEKLENPLKPIIRVATYKDKKHHEENKQKEKEADIGPTMCLPEPHGRKEEPVSVNYPLISTCMLQHI